MNELISTLKKKKKKGTGGEYMVKHSPKILASEEEATTTTVLMNIAYSSGNVCCLFASGRWELTVLVLVGIHAAL